MVVVTGASEGGIGWHLAVEFRKHGCTVFGTARRVDSLGGLSALGIEAVALDVTDPGSVRKAIAEASGDQSESAVSHRALTGSLPHISESRLLSRPWAHARSRPGPGASTSW